MHHKFIVIIFKFVVDKFEGTYNFFSQLEYYSTKRSSSLSMGLSSGGVLALGAGPRAVQAPGEHGVDQAVQV